jgi:pyridoxine 5-phosphate synthase
MPSNSIYLGVNVDHIATLRQARGTEYPDPVQAALIAEAAGASNITMHLREDRRHIQEHDVIRLVHVMRTSLNFEMAVTEEMLTFAGKVKPQHCCLVPEKREELTTEGGLDVLQQQDKIYSACQRLAKAGIEVSLFIDPDLAQLAAAKQCGAPAVEIHTGSYADAKGNVQQTAELNKIKIAARWAKENGFIVNAGHGLNTENVQAIAAIPEILTLNIGHAIVARSVFVGLREAVQEIKNLMDNAR